MTQVTKFEDKVKAAMNAVMRHAVAGHFDRGYNTFCSKPDHAVAILIEYGIRPVNEAVARKVLDGNLTSDPNA